MRLFSLLVFVLLTHGALAQTVEVTFEIFMDDKKIGELKAVEERTTIQSSKEVRTVTETRVVAVSAGVESEILSKKENDVLIEGTAYRRAYIGPGDIQSSIKRIGDKLYLGERNGETQSLTRQDITFCVADLYFNEPKGKTTIFSNMHVDNVALKQLSTGRYQLVTPDNKDSIYTYRNGKLVQIEVDTPLGLITTKRS